MQTRQKKLLPWMTILGIVACVSMVVEIMKLVDIDFSLMIPMAFDKTIFVIPAVSCSLYLLFSALAHFRTGKAIGLWFGILVPVICEVGSLFLVDFGFNSTLPTTQLHLIVGFPLPIPAFALVLAVVAIVKRDVRFGWVSAALLFGFWLGFMVLFMGDGGLDDVIKYCWWQFAGIGVFAIVDLCCIIRSVRRERITAAQ